jgi:hypothetical protein
MDIWPQDEYRFYDAPKLTSVTSGGPTAPTVLIPADLNRRVLILSGNSSTTIYVAPVPNFVTFQGIPLPPACPFISLDWNTHRSLVQSAWWFIATAGEMGNAITIAMPRNPQQYGYKDAFLDQADETPAGGDWNYQSGPSGIFMATPLPADLAYRLKSISPGLWGGQ